LNLRKDNQNMRILLATLLLALSLPASAESTWLVLLYGKSFDANGAVGAALEKIEMPDIEKCRLEGEKWIKSDTFRKTSDIGFHCVQGI
jgi:hypothetical protein